MAENHGLSDSDADQRLNGTYTLDEGLLKVGEALGHHVVDIPLTPRDMDTALSRLPPIEDEAGKQGNQSKKKKKEKRKSSRSRSVPEATQQLTAHDSDASTATYTMPVPSTADASQMVESSGAVPTIESPFENRPTSLKKRTFSKPDTMSVLEPSSEDKHLKSKTFGKKLKKRKKTEEELGLDIEKENIRREVKAKFHQKVPENSDEVDHSAAPSDKLAIARPYYGGSRASLRSQGYRVIKTQAFGRINFNKNAKTSYEPPYISLSNTDSKDDLLQLILEQWQLPEPKLIVSIVGGAKRFQFAKSRVSALFKQGLLDIATTTGAWILTPGSHTGVYEMVGSAVKDHVDATGSATMNNIVLLGIASWGSVASRDRLVNPTGEGSFPADYPIADIAGSKGTQPLDPNHSHFILVDDGSRDKFGGEIKWRAEFEKFLTEHVLSGMDAKEGETDEVHIPLVTLLINGGVGSLEACAESLSIQIPLVAIAGSGRAAEVVVLLKELYHGRDTKWRPTRDQLISIYEKAMGTKPTSNMLACLKAISDNHHYISTFDFTHAGASTDDVGLDRAILSALHHKGNMDVSRMKAQLRLALAWGRDDYARDDILDSNISCYREFMKEKSFLYEIAMQSLIDDLPDFINLLLDNGLSLADFVTEQRLEKLYQKSMLREEGYSRYVKSLLSSVEYHKKSRCGSCVNSVDPRELSYMHQIGRLFKDLLGYTYPNIYKKVDDKNSLSCYENSCVFIDPAQHLFLWAAIFNRMDMAKMFWRMSEDHIAGAIVGASLMRGIAKKSNQQDGLEITNAYLTNSLKFEALANGILEYCWSKDRQYTSDMLVREAPNWGNTTVLSMAYHGEMEEFLAQPACYTKLNKIWRGDIALGTHVFWIVLFALVPIMAFKLKFVRKSDDDPRLDERQDDPVFLEDLNRDDSEDKSPALYQPLLTVSLLGREKKEISYPVAIFRAMRSPLVKCVYNSVTILVFLFVYALFLMTELAPYLPPLQATNATDPCLHCCAGTRIGCLELTTYCFALLSFLEEIRQIWFRDTRSMKYAKQKFIDWFGDFWNKVDLLSYILFVTAMVLRFNLKKSEFEAARWLFSFSFMVYFIRFSQVFYVVEQLGPKIIMIKKMMVDLLFFIVILSMTILTFGVISNSLLYPEADLKWSLLNNVTYKPYFQMYGELFLEDNPYEEGYRWILLGIYMILTNILLLNLLIAMFSYTFEQVQEKAEILWKFNYYAVVFEHFDRPHLPLIGTLVQMFAHCRCSKNSTLCNKDKNTDFRRRLEDDANSKITKFVKVCMEKYVAQISKEELEDMSNKVTNTARRLEMVIEQLDDLRDDVISQQSKPRPSHTPLVHSGELESLSKSKTSSHLEKKIKSLDSKLEAKFERLTSVEQKLDRITDLLLHSQQHQLSY